VLVNALKAGTRRVVAHVAQAAGLSLAALKGRVVVLAYHRVVSSRELARQPIQPGMYVHVDSFERQMRFLKDWFAVLPLAEVLDRWETGRWDPGRRYCAITFDDGWRDNHTYAYPILTRYGLPSTIFVCTDLVGTDRWFWPDRLLYLVREAARKPWHVTPRSLLARILPGGKVGAPARGSPGDLAEHAIAVLKGKTEREIEDVLEGFRRDLDVPWPAERVLLDWREVEEMSRGGVSFGSHGCSHRILTLCSDDDVEREVAGSLRTLTGKSVNVVPVFAFPNGSYDDRVLRHLRKAGYRAALTTDSGHEGLLGGDPFRIRRIGIHDDVTRSVSLFTFHLSGYLQRVSGG
jgi:peptidoglycan/xylan/chitin deacetylase (PgdA/CDA1 family)